MKQYGWHVKPSGPWYGLSSGRRCSSCHPGRTSWGCGSHCPRQRHGDAREAGCEGACGCPECDRGSRGGQEGSHRVPAPCREGLGIRGEPRHWTWSTLPPLSSVLVPTSVVEMDLSKVSLS